MEDLLALAKLPINLHMSVYVYIYIKIYPLNCSLKCY